MALGAAGDIGAVAALQHQPFDAGLARPGPQTLELCDRAEVEHVGDIGARRLAPRVPFLEPRAALDEGEGPQILLAVEQHVVEADMGRMRFQHRGVTVLRFSRCCRSLNGATSPLA